MTLITRLKKLEGTRPSSTGQKNSRDQLLKSLKETFERLGKAPMTEGWLSQQSNMTALAIAIYDPSPWPDALRKRLQAIADQEGSGGKFARAVLESAS